MVAVITKLTQARRAAGRRTLAAKGQGPQSSLNRGHLVRSLILYSHIKNKSGNIILAVVLGATFLITGSAIILRSQGSYLGSFFSSESKESREAALYGQKVIISEMARTPNRGLLLARQKPVSGGSPLWILPNSWVDPASNTAVLNPCAITTAGAPVPPTPISGVTDTTKPLLVGQSDKRYWLRSVEFKNEASTGTSRSSVLISRPDVSSPWSAVERTASGSAPYQASLVTLAGSAARGYIELEVQGESVQGGKTSISRIKKEYEVIPKCCGRSFGLTRSGDSLGADERSCPAYGLGLFSLVTGANGDGIFNISGRAFDLFEGSTGVNQDQAITLNPLDIKPLDSDTNLVGTTQKLPPQNLDTGGTAFANSGCINGPVTLPIQGLPGLDFDPGRACPEGAAIVNETIYQEKSGNATRTGRNPNFVYSCDSGEYSAAPNTSSLIPNGGILTNSRQENLANQTPSSQKCYVQATRTTNTPLPYCTQEPGTQNYFCKIRYVNAGSTSEVVIDTTGDKIVTLLFTDGTLTEVPGGDIEGGSAAFPGSGGFRHIKDGVDASLADAFRFRIVNTITNSDFQLKGAQGALSGFFDLRLSNVFASGGGANSTVNLSGILWTNNLTLGGNIVFVNPQSGDCSDPDNIEPDTLCGLLNSIYPELFDDDPLNDTTNPANDWTPRSIFSLNLFQ